MAPRTTSLRGFSNDLFCLHGVLKQNIWEAIQAILRGFEWLEMGFSDEFVKQKVHLDLFSSVYFQKTINFFVFYLLRRIIAQLAHMDWKLPSVFFYLFMELLVLLIQP